MLFILLTTIFLLVIAMWWLMSIFTCKGRQDDIDFSQSQPQTDEWEQEEEDVPKRCPFYCINMESAYKRRKHIHNAFVNNMGLNVEFIPGVDTRGKQWEKYKRFLTNDGLSRLQIAIQKNRRLRHHELTPGAVGCFLSHVACWKKFLGTNPKDNDMVFILEDDSQPHPEFLDVLDSVLQSPPPDADLILFSYISFGNKTKVKYGNMEYELLRRPSRFYLLNAYMISGKGARKTLDLLEKNDMRFEKQIDSHMTDLVNLGHINVYNLMEDMCPQTPLGPTSIQTVPMQERNNKKKQ